MRIQRFVARLPIRAKLTLAYTGVIALMLAAIGLFLYLHFKSGVDGGLNATLRARADDVGAFVRHEGVAGLASRRDLLAGGDLTTQILDRTGTVLYTSAGTADSPLLTPQEIVGIGHETRYIDRGEDERLLVRRVAEPDGRVLVVRASLAQRERSLELLNGALLVGGGLTLIVAALSGYGLAAAVLRPVEAMRRAAARISDVDPNARLPLPVAEDEVHRLGRTLNDMLARLERSRDRERAFVSDASHELRAPLSLLKTEVEVALRTDNPPEALRAALRVVGEEADRLSQLAEDLLLVASSDSGRLELERKPTDARTILEDIERRFRLRAREGGRQLRLDAPADVSVLADTPRIEQALSNLVENALRHGAGTITLRARSLNGFAELHVLDEGPGLPPEFVPHAFERFTRSDPGRTGAGTGLGLAIVDVIAAAHGGEARIANRADPPGSDAWVRLPSA